MTMPSIPLIPGMRQLADQYGGMICDVWGVVFDGLHPLPDAVEALQKFRRNGGRVVLLTNAPRPGGRIIDQIGLPSDCMDAIVSSGDVARAEISSGRHGRAGFHIGPERDLPLFQDTGMESTGDEAAEFILCTGLFNDSTESPDDYRDRLTALAQRGMIMLCANPDIAVHRGGRRIPCAGALAVLYRELGGEVVAFGKPHPPVYRHALDALVRCGGPSDAAGVIAVGDGMETDIRGADNVGLDALFITGGLPADDIGPQPSAQEISDLCARHELRPVAAMSRMAW